MNKPLELVFKVNIPPDYSSGLNGVYDTIKVVVDSGDPGGEPGEFTEFMLGCLKDWYDTPNVMVLQPEGDSNEEVMEGENQ